MCETNYTQATAGNRPTYNATGVGGLPSLDFDGNDWLDAPATALGIFCEVEQAWVLAVYKHGVADVVTTERPIAFWTNNSTPTRVCLFASPTGEMNKPNIGGRRLDADAFGGVTATAALATNEECILLGYLNFSARTAQLYKNGVLDASATGLWSAGGATSNTVSTRARIGGNGTVTTPSTFLNGKVANIAAGASVLNASQIDKLFGWAAHRHALTGLLPSDHPYKTVPPMVS
jgi:hypothetical protein